MNNDTFCCATAAADQALGLAVRAAALADEIDALHRVIRAAGDERVRRAGFRCDTAAGSIRQVGTELAETADDLEHIAAAMKPGACSIAWGVCPEHGNTLASSGRETWCRLVGCCRTWNYDRVGLPCIEPARWKVADRHGACLMMCHGHALNARKRLECSHVELREEFA